MTNDLRAQQIFNYIAAIIALFVAVVFLIYGKDFLSYSAFFAGLLVLTFFHLYVLDKNIKKIMKKIFYYILFLILVFFIQIQIEMSDITFDRESISVFGLILITWTLVYEFFIRKITDIGFVRYLFKGTNLHFADWISQVTGNDQGTDFREINLLGGRLEELEFKVAPETPYWRAGFKLTVPNGFILPLLSRDSLLVHLGSNPDHEGVNLSIYKNGVEIKHEFNILPKGQLLSFHVHANAKNFLFVKINGGIKFQERIHPDLLKRVFMAAWNDGNNAKVEFKDIRYKAKER